VTPRSGTSGDASRGFAVITHNAREFIDSTHNESKASAPIAGSRQSM
jgi:hypothetical protein